MMNILLESLHASPPTRRRTGGALLVASLLSALGAPAVAGPYDTAMSNGSAWLLQQRNVVDGSWGSEDTLKYTHTSEAVLALAALNRKDAIYYGGVSWLSNHLPANLDASARKILTLSTVGGSVGADVQKIKAGQQTVIGGNNGWGLSSLYSGAPLDTGLALQALKLQNIAAPAPTAVAYLIGAQLSGTDGGWALGQETISDPFTTAQVIIGMKPFSGINVGAPNSIARGLTALNAKVNSDSPVPQIAIAIVANLRNDPASAFAASLLAALTRQQATNGSWSNNSYSTALALRALAVASGRDLQDQQQVVNIPDSNLRAAINGALGRSALDAITAGQLQQLTSLSLSGKGISNLTGLELATGLTFLDLSNNPIDSYSPISGLAITAVIYTGDINADGAVDIADLQLLQKKLLGSATLNSQQAVRADIFPIGVGDAAIDVADLWALQQKLLSKASL